MSNNSDLLLARTKDLLRRFRLQARKGLGQHFLIDPEIIQISVAAAELSKESTVIEVGPGLGVLTEELARSAGKVIAIEIDPRIADLLSRRLRELNNVIILNESILDVDIVTLFNTDEYTANYDYKVVANLPYYVAAPTIRHFLEAEVKPRRMVVMVQKEVAESIAAVPGKMNLLSVSVQLYGRPSIVEYVPAESFYPPPKVDSAIVRIDVYHQPAVAVEIEGFFKVVKAGFSAPRKQIRNSLAQGLSVAPSRAAEILNRAKISPQRRAETLNLEEWATLYREVDCKISNEN